jgi:type II secretory pathway pseudopilin PulG
MRSKFAFTLIELLVYMAILGFIIVVAGRAFSDSTSMRVRSHNMVKTSEVVGNASSLLREDISQMGTKVWGLPINSEYRVFAHPAVYWSNGDPSSYELNEDQNSLSFKKAAFDEDGRFIAVHRITWRLDGSQLVRECVTENAPCPTGVPAAACNTGANNAALCPAHVVIADNVANFKLTPSMPGIAGSAQDDTLFGKVTTPNASPNFSLLSRTTGSDVIAVASTNLTTSTEAVVLGFANNPLGSGKSFNQLYLAAYGTSGWQNCAKFTFERGETYAIEFSMPFTLITGNAENDTAVFNSTQFLPGRDHLAIGLRTSSGDAISGAPNDILFYPPQQPVGNFPTPKRHMEFSVSETINDACVAITMAFYNPNPNIGANFGRLRFSNFRVLRKPSEAFHFPSNGYGVGSSAPAEEKQNVKAFEVILEIEHRGEKAGTFSSDEKGMIITTPNNGVIAL